MWTYRVETIDIYLLTLYRCLVGLLRGENVIHLNVVVFDNIADVVHVGHDDVIIIVDDTNNFV